MRVQPGFLLLYDFFKRVKWRCIQNPTGRLISTETQDDWYMCLEQKGFHYKSCQNQHVNSIVALKYFSLIQTVLLVNTDQ